MEKDTASSLSKVGGGKTQPEKTQPKQPAVELLPSLHFKGEKDAVWGTATRASGFAAESLGPDFLNSRLNPEKGGKLRQLPALHRAEVSRNRVSYRKQMAFGRKIRLSNEKFCVENRGKSIR